MNQHDFLPDFDAEIRSALAGAGLANEATFTQYRSATTVDCTVYVDRGVSFEGPNGVVVNDQTVITGFLSEIEAPQVGAKFTVAGTIYQVDRITVRDESRVACLVREVSA